MLYRKMNKNHDSLSILGFGCMRLPQKKGTPGDGKIDEKRATEQIRMAIDAGVNYIDTAVPYHMGASEPFLSRALRGGMGIEMGLEPSRGDGGAFRNERRGSCQRKYSNSR